jgi:hypothetical protein
MRARRFWMARTWQGATLAERSAREKRSLPLPPTLCKISRAESFSFPPTQITLDLRDFFCNMTQSIPSGTSGHSTVQIGRDLGLNNPGAQAAAVARADGLEARRKGKEDKIIRDLAKKGRNEARHQENSSVLKYHLITLDFTVGLV